MIAQERMRPSLKQKSEEAILRLRGSHSSFQGRFTAGTVIARDWLYSGYVHSVQQQCEYHVTNSNTCAWLLRDPVAYITVYYWWHLLQALHSLSLVYIFYQLTHFYIFLCCTRLIFYREEGLRTLNLATHLHLWYRQLPQRTLTLNLN